LTDDGQTYHCRIKGKFRTKELQTTNPVAVGDLVAIEPETDQDTAVITKLYDRRNYIIRKSVNLSKQAQILAANLDQACLVVTLASPFTSTGFIDRFLVTAEAYDIPAALIFNKLGSLCSGRPDRIGGMSPPLYGYRLSLLRGIGTDGREPGSGKNTAKRQNYTALRPFRRG